MPVIDGIKFACAPCMRGHRATTCMHHDRLLLEVRKPGRPLTSCPHKSDICSCDAVTANKLGGSKPSVKKYRKIEKKPAKRPRTSSPENRGDSEDGLRCTSCSAKLHLDCSAKEGREVEEDKLLQRHSPSTRGTLPPTSSLPQTQDPRINDTSHIHQPYEIIETLRPVPSQSNSPKTLPPISAAISPTNNIFEDLRRAHVAEAPRPPDPFLPSISCTQKFSVATAFPALQERQLPPPYVHASRVEDISFYNTRAVPGTGSIARVEVNMGQKVEVRDPYSGITYSALARSWYPEAIPAERV